jgi:uncharacterized protein YndB with AHSA1/START domain
MQLAVTTPSETEIRVERIFDAPPQLVFECHTKPELVQRWLLGPPGWSMPICKIDLRVGGRYRYVWRNDAEGREFGVQGEFREIDAPHRIVHSESMDGRPGEAQCTLTLSPSGTKTSLEMTIRFDSREIRDAALETGMTDGISMSYDRLSEVMNAAPSVQI